MAAVKKAKAQDGKELTPTYKNLRMGVANKRKSVGQRPNDGYGATKEDSALYRFGYNRGLKGEKEYPGEPEIQKSGRWEGQNAVKKAAPKKKMMGGGKLTKAKSGKDMLKRADGSVSQRGLWDNLRNKAAKNKASGAKPKAPSKAMLSQEKKIKAKGK